MRLGGHVEVERKQIRRSGRVGQDGDIGVAKRITDGCNGAVSTARNDEVEVLRACDQIVDLADNGVDGIHIYTMNRPVIGRAAREALLGCGYLWT